MMNTLYFEVVGAVVLAGVLGLLSGWMAHRAKARRSMRRAVAYWQKRCEELMPAEGENAESLQARVSSLDQLLGAETVRTRELETQLGAANGRLEKARGDAIRLNSQQAGIQERLQRIIREKDHELAELTRRADRAAAADKHDEHRESAVGTRPKTLPASAAGDEIEAYIDRLSDRGERAGRGAQPSSPSSTADAPVAAAAVSAASTAHASSSAAPAAGGQARSSAPDPAPDTDAKVFDDAAAHDIAALDGDVMDVASLDTADLDGADLDAARLDDASLNESGLDEVDLDEADLDEADLDDTLDATAVIDMETEHDVTATRRIDPDPLDATSQEPMLYDEDTIAFDEDTIAFDAATLARVRERSHEV